MTPGHRELLDEMAAEIEHEMDEKVWLIRSHVTNRRTLWLAVDDAAYSLGRELGHLARRLEALETAIAEHDLR